MIDVMMLLGGYPFMVDTAAYQQLKRDTSYRWKQIDLIGGKPNTQYLGVDADKITISGYILPEFKGGAHQLDLIRSAANEARPLQLIAGDGRVLGYWVVLKVSETQSVFNSGGRPRRIDFTLDLSEYHGNTQRLSLLDLSFAAVRAVTGAGQ